MYKKLLLGIVRVPTQNEYEKAVTDGDKEQVKIGDLNELRILFSVQIIL